MTSSAPILQRMQTHRANARRMLTPGLKSPAGQQRPFSPVLDDFGSQKYSQIAQKIRFLKGERLGAFTPEKVNLIGRELPAKFANPAALLHIKPAASASEADTSIWSAIEQVLPAGTGAGPISQAPAEPGTLRQGSLIQRVQTVPKPGQSFESFKEQVQSRASSAKPVAQPPKPPKPGDPAVRRYSRIEEVSAKETPAPPDPPAEGPVTPPPPATVQRQPEPLVDTPSPEIDRRTPDQPAPVLEPPAVREARTPDQPVSASEPPGAREARTPDQPVSASEPPAPPEARTPDQPAPVSEAPAAPVVEPLARAETSLLRALPAPKKDLPPSEPTLPKARPVPLVRPDRIEKARPASVLYAGEQAKSPTTSTPRLVSSRPAVVQRQPTLPADDDVRLLEPASESGLPVEITPKLEPDSPKQADIPSTPEPEQKVPPAQPVARQSEAPLQAHLAQRRAAPQQIRFLEPRLFKPEVNRPRLIRPELRATQASAPRERLDLPSAPPMPTTIPVRQPGLPPAPTASPEIEMPVARPQEPRPAASPVFAPGGAQSLTASPREVAQTPLPQPLAATQPDQPQRVETRSPTASPAAGNVVQRLWDEHSPPASSSGGRSGDSARGESGESALDLDKLAEDVLPVVKRLIEIESERSSGYFR